ncbi:PTS sugar transporter subunit IIA [Clostridium sp. JN-9]|uniref:PTS sugar transporter subunit IIA n=1 Tax=Clostridium sp. JN-9 TaxID=2507159 RepID=UPI000FFE1529|nr:PTS sugar transporter subunit IIA [Clostridium sp. JN-9]QAT39169.1 PTS sugar transporter subunit IIA [Clostridium sp. JN-9]
MVGIIAISHGNYVKELINSVELIYGKIDEIEAICLEKAESIESLNSKIELKIKGLDADEILILVDLLGGTPYNASSLWMKNPNINVVTGINMPMLLEILPHRNEGLMKVSKIAEESAKNGIINVGEKYKTLNKPKII